MASSGSASSSPIQCHYDVLQVPRDADAATIKKAHRKLALQFHPDKNTDSKEDTHEKFRLVQQAYECLSDPAERKWYDQHRDAILKGWSANNNESVDILFDVVPFQHPSCYNGYDDNNESSFFGVYRMVFEQIYQGEQQGWVSEGNIEDMPLHDLPVDFGSSTMDWSDVASFYQGWESFTSCLSFAWADVYDVKEAPNRRVKRAMEDENKKQRRVTRKERNDDVVALVHFVKRRDPRVKAHFARVAQEKARKRAEQEELAKQRKAQAIEARETWRADAERTMAELEEEDRLAGRVRLADLEDDYDYGGGKRGKKGKRKNKQRDAVQDCDVENSEEDENGNPMESKGGVNDSSDGEDLIVATESGAEENDVDTEHVLDENEFYTSESSSEEEDEEPDFWRCECCRKDFKSEGQMENHMKSKKHKEAFKKYQNRRKQESSAMDELIDELALDS